MYLFASFWNILPRCLSQSFRRWVLFFLLFAKGLYSNAQAPNIYYSSPPQTYIYNPGDPVRLEPTNKGGAVPPVVYGTITVLPNAFEENLGASTAVVTDAEGNLYVCDYYKNQIKEINVSTNAVTVVAGTNANGTKDGPGYQASFFEPNGIAIDANGNLFVSDQNNYLIREIGPGPTYNVSTFAGSGIFGSTDGLGTSASFKSPRGMAIDGSGTIYVADYDNKVIRKISPGGLVSTINGTSFGNPSGLCIDASGNLYVADASRNVITKIEPGGQVYTFVAGLNKPRDIVVDKTGYFYVTDQGSNTVKRISPSGVVTTLPNTPGTYHSPIGLTLDGRGNLYVADNENGTVKKVVVLGYTIDKPLPAGLSFDPTTGIISGTPTTKSDPTDYTITAFNATGASSTVVNIQVTNSTRLPSVITFPAIDASHYDGNPITPRATSTNTNTQTPITYASSDQTIANVIDGTLHIYKPGTVTITASQAGNGTYLPAAPVPVTLTVMLDQVIDFAPIAAKTICSGDFSVSATDHDEGFGFPPSSIAITYSSSNTDVAEVSATTGMAHIKSAGTTVITAQQDGNAFYNAASPQTQTLTVTTGLAPVVTVTPSTLTLCSGLLVTFTANVSNLSDLVNPTYQWQVNGANVGTNSSTYPTSIISSTDVVTCEVSNNDACPATKTATSPGIAVLTDVTLTATITSSATGVICSGTTVTFTATPNYSDNNTNYQWQVNGAPVGGNSAQYVNDNFADGDLVTCTITNTQAPCLITTAFTPTEPIKLTIVSPQEAAPSVTITASADHVYAGLPITFTAAVTNAGSDITYQWQVNGVNAGTNGSAFTTTTLTNGDNVTCTVTPGISCVTPVTSLPITVTILPPLTITPPNAFTPNGDGVNDLWVIAGLATYPDCKIKTYNRYGKLVFQSVGYSKPWDGLYNGAHLPVGTYYYVIDFNKSKISGYVELIR